MRIPHSQLTLKLKNEYDLNPKDWVGHGLP